MKDNALPNSTCPRIPAPSGPVRSGIFSTPAARMTGADSRNENRAASCRDSPRNMPLTMTMPSRLMPGSSARICIAPRPTAFRKPTPTSLRSACTARLACSCFNARCPDECRPPPTGPGPPAATVAFCRSAAIC